MVCSPDLNLCSFLECNALPRLRSLGHSSFSALFRNTTANSSSAVFTYHSLASLMSSTHSAARCRYSFEVGMVISPDLFQSRRANEHTVVLVPGLPEKMATCKSNAWAPVLGGARITNWDAAETYSAPMQSPFFVTITSGALASALGASDRVRGDNKLLPLSRRVNPSLTHARPNRINRLVRIDLSPTSAVTGANAVRSQQPNAILRCSAGLKTAC